MKFSFPKKIMSFVFIIFSSFLFFLVSIYPYFAVTSAYNLNGKMSLDGTFYLKEMRPEDHRAIEYLNKNVKGQPIILEAQGDSYTDYGRISVNTGLPTVLGWTVHEWLWRGSYDIPAGRFDDIKNLYESNNLSLTQKIINKYNISFVYIGGLEKEKYKVYENKFKILGEPIYTDKNTKIYKIN
ncbi:MAG: hypothetical protein HYV38_03245 [Candidatus Levybacteria bacterium]|nr:hypothetical protein [Candidatus Levybacteria bacterium]